MKECKDCLADFVGAMERWEEAWLAEQEHATDHRTWLEHYPRPKMAKRPAPHPGPRCATHDRLASKKRSAKTHDRRIQRTYGLEPGEYGQLLAFQGGTCAIPRCKARGVVKRLALDHNHATLEPRGLLCGPHNRLIGASYDDPEVFRAIATYLEDPPYKRMKRENGVDEIRDEAQASPHDRRPAA